MASPLLGYNTNVRHHGKVFHIQTEDSGVGHGHIFTHLFADGGRIVATKKTDYKPWIGTDRYPSSVKKLMQAQHKAMFIALRDGLFDTDEVAGAREFSARQITIDEETTGVIQTVDPKAAPPPAVEVDLDALEKAADSHLAASPASRAPASVPPRAADDTGRTSSPARTSQPSSARTSSPGRYAQTQPAQVRPRVQPRAQDSLFGSDLLSEKSLDEVIMSYLAEDLEEKE